MNRICLNGEASSSLDWSGAIEEAKGAQKIFWEIDLGLFDRLAQPLADRTQLLSLRLALEHFRESLWTPFQEKSVGVCIYRGALPFPGEGCPEYLAELAEALPESCRPSVYLDASLVHEKEALLPLLDRSRYGRLKLEGEGLLHCGNAPSAICLGDCYEGAASLFEKLKEPFRLIPEAFLTAEWEGLDRLFVFPKGVSESGKRMLLGFCAAGGEVVTVGSPFLGLPGEISFAQWAERQ